MILATQLHSEAPVQLLAERSCGTSLLRRGFGAETNVVKIQLGGRRGSVIRGHALVDNADADLAVMCWSMMNGGYAAAKQTTILMHRVVLTRIVGRELATSEFCDHINGNRIDNQRANLRLVNNSQNLQNQHHLRPDNTSGFRGVHWNKRANKWEAYVNVGREKIYCGLFNTQEIAAQAAADKRSELGFLTNTL